MLWKQCPLHVKDWLGADTVVNPWFNQSIQQTNDQQVKHCTTIEHYLPIKHDQF